jgi:type I restriction enzyme S subunit
MELKPGYKQTEVGVIPEDWDCKNLRELCKKITDGTHDTPKPVANGIPFLTAIHVKEGGIDYENCLYLKKEDHEIIFARCNPQRGDVLFVNIGAGVATTAVVSVDYEFSLKNVALLKPSAELLGSYLNHCISSRKEEIVNALSSGGAQPFLSLSKIAEIPIPAPSLAEQEGISQTLNNTDALLIALKRLIAKKRLIKQAAMQELLTGKRRLPGFKGEWEVKRLGSEIRDLQAGVSVTSTTDNDQANTDHYVLKTSAVVQGRFIPSEKKEISPSEVKRAKTSIRKGDLIISRMNTPALVGECGYSDSDHPNLYLPDRLWRAAYRDPYAISSHWLSYVLSMQKNRIRIKDLATGTSGSMKNISKRALLDLEIKWPSLEEQTVIAEALSEMDADTDSISKHILKAQGIKQGMMQQLLTGKIRLR